MNGKLLYEFYEKVLLPQFGLKGIELKWSSSDDVGPDESVHYFSTNTDKYALIFEDFGGLASSEQWIKEKVKIVNNKFEYINPTSHTDHRPSYPIKFPTPYEYCKNITGTFTLVKL